MIPDSVKSENELEELLSIPSPALVDLMGSLEGDLMILGIGGKIGPSLGRTAVRAIADSGKPRKIYGVSRFSDPTARESVEAAGINAISCDLLDDSALRELPEVQNIVFMAGRKFGTSGSEELTWAMNVLVPANVARRFSKSRIVVFSTGCVYPLVTPEGGGCSESDPPGPVGEYASSCLGRERVFEYYSGVAGTPVCILRLNYAIDLRYGVLFDIASRVWNGEAVSLSVPFVNIIWQGDVNNLALCALQECESPPEILNITGPETLSVHALALQFGKCFGKKVLFDESAGVGSLLSDASRSYRTYGYPSVPLAAMIEWTAAWVADGRRSLGKPTHFETNDGRY